MLVPFLSHLILVPSVYRILALYYIGIQYIIIIILHRLNTYFATYSSPRVQEIKQSVSRVGNFLLHSYILLYNIQNGAGVIVHSSTETFAQYNNISPV